MKRSITSMQGSLDGGTYLEIISSDDRTWQEPTLLALQEAFLTPGFHTIKVSEVRAGRELVARMLKSVGCYQMPTCLTLSCIPLLHGNDLLRELTLSQTFLPGKVQGGMLEEYLLSNFYADFLWIECCDQLVSLAWFARLKELLELYNFTNSIPIIMLAYGQEIL